MAARKAGRSVRRAAGHVAKGAWRKLRKGKAATRSGELDDHKNSDIQGPTDVILENYRGGSRDGSGNSKPLRFAFLRRRRPPCETAPPIFNPTSDEGAKILAAQRALGGSDASAVQLSLRVNVLALTMLGLYAYFKMHQRLRLWRCQQRRQPQHRLGAGFRARIALRIGSDSGRSVREWITVSWGRSGAVAAFFAYGLLFSARLITNVTGGVA